MYSYAIRMPFVCHSYALVCHSHVTLMRSYVIRMSLVCTRMSSIYHSYVTRMHSYVIPMLLSCARMSSVCHSYVLVYHSYVPACHSVLHSYSHSYMFFPWTVHLKHRKKEIDFKKRHIIEEKATSMENNKGCWNESYCCISESRWDVQYLEKCTS